jgi:hypothetical protein
VNRNIDPRLNGYVMTDGLVRGVRCGILEATPAPGETYWRLVTAELLDETEAQDKHNVYVNALDEQGLPIEQRFEVGWPWERWPEMDGHHYGMTAMTIGNIPIYGGYSPEAAGYGPYWVRMLPWQSDVFYGMGLPYRHHVSYVLTFQRVKCEAVPVDPPTPPVPDEGLQHLRELLVDTAELHEQMHRVLARWMQIAPPQNGITYTTLSKSVPVTLT